MTVTQSPLVVTNKSSTERASGTNGSKTLDCVQAQNKSSLRLGQVNQTSIALFVSRGTVFTLWGNQPMNGLRIVIFAYYTGIGESILRYNHNVYS